MSTTPGLDPTQQPPPFPPVIQEHVYKPHSGHGSVGPVIGAVAVVMVLGAVAVMIGRLCSGRRVMGHVQYDFEGWIETKCATCIDGRLDLPPRREAVPVVVVVEGDVSNEASSEATVAQPQVIRAERVQSQGEEASNHQEVEEQGNVHES